MDRPSGTVTFVFTDIEGSTRLWEEYPTAMQSCLALHDGIMRSTIERHGGYVFSTAGDAFAAAFARAGDAILAAVEAQRMLGSADWGDLSVRVRMGVHTGEAEERAGDFFGPALNRGARLMAAAYGGQVLVSLATEQVVVGGFPDGVSLVDLGEHRLKDLSRPERIFQVCSTDLPSVFAPLRTVDATLNNLPIQPTSFVGRDQERAELEKLVRGARLVTVTGVGGGGKTRLTLQAAAELLDEFPDGVWFVDLAPLDDPALVAPAVAAVLGLREVVGQPLLDTVGLHLESRRTLLVLDNCEHLLDGVAAVAGHLLAHTVEVRMLASSREPIRVRGEVTYPLLTLPTPELDAGQGEIIRAPAVRLFAERGAAVRPDFRLTADTIAPVAEICRLLDGIPLALELAAARLGVMSPAQIAARLDDRFRLLTSGHRDDLAHHRTLEATIDWSYQLLPETGQNLFGRLSVFRGGFDLEAAEVICVGGDIEPFAVADLLFDLVDRSLVVADQTGDTVRYRLLETLRQFTDRKLVETGEKGQLQRKHATYYIERAESFEVLGRSDEDTAFGAYERDYENLIATLEWCLDQDETDLAMRFLAAVGIYWFSRGNVPKGGAWIKGLFDTSASVASAIRARALVAAGVVSFAKDFGTARAYLEEAVQMLRQLEEQNPSGFSWLARALCNLGVAVASEGSGDLVGARRLTEEARDLAHRKEDSTSEGIALMNLSILTLELGGDLDEAAGMARRATDLFRHSGMHSRLAESLSELGEIEVRRGNSKEGEALLRESIRLSTDHHYRPGQIDTSHRLARWLTSQGAHAEANQLLANVLPLLEQAPTHYAVEA
ncbi:MAG: adenylate/guanylate cyclase domain-containing protein, partial [Acidimicrobiia bacterium]|nr:adenylate/guanylate cyclase domain-containing protein [Acidimicrobiia bacterium]